MPRPHEVSAVLVTRGDVDMDPIVDSILAQGIRDIVIWDNSKNADVGISGRYEAIDEAAHDIIVTQDDDLLVDCYERLCADYQPGILTVNYKEPWDIPWVSCGSIFDRNLPDLAFERYFTHHPYDHLFTHRICDAVFALLSETKVVDYGHVDLDYGYHAGRVSTSDGWYDRDRPEAQRRCQELLKVAA